VSPKEISFLLTRVVVGLEGTSQYYGVTLLHVTDVSLREMTEHFCRMRYFNGLNKELKDIHKNPTLLRFVCDIYEWLRNKNEAFCTSVYLQKDEYTGPYLSEAGYGGYDPQKFRNYVFRRALEYHFHKHTEHTEEIEIVIDRYDGSNTAEADLFAYLQGNYNIPNILHLVQVDSRYVEGIQLADLLSRTIKAKKVDEWSTIADGDLDFAEIVCLNQIPKTFPNKIYIPK
jgi:hypothetical protein